jgi:hypothetical protein
LQIQPGRHSENLLSVAPSEEVIATDEAISLFDGLILSLKHARARIHCETNLLDDSSEVQEIVYFGNVEPVT